LTEHLRWLKGKRRVAAGARTVMHGSEKGQKKGISTFILKNVLIPFFQFFFQLPVPLVKSGDTRLPRAGW
jgi:hypothetical protein